MKSIRLVLCLVLGFSVVSLVMATRPRGIKTLTHVTGTIVRVNSAGYMVPAYIVVKSSGHEPISLIVDDKNTFYVGEKGNFEYDADANPKILLSFVPFCLGKCKSNGIEAAACQKKCAALGECPFGEE